MVSSEWTEAMKVCIALREVAEAVTLCGFTQVCYRSYAIRLINRGILKIRKEDLSGEEFYWDYWHNNAHTKLIRPTKHCRRRNNQNTHTHTHTSVLMFLITKRQTYARSSENTFKVISRLGKHSRWLSKEQAKGWNGFLSWAAVFFMTLSAQTILKTHKLTFLLVKLNFTIDP